MVVDAAREVPERAEVLSAHPATAAASICFLFMYLLREDPGHVVEPICDCSCGHGQYGVRPAAESQRHGVRAVLRVAG
ncbi:hypothetical protein GCM10027028_59990 [Streptomyces sundarbansensis]